MTNVLLVTERSKSLTVAQVSSFLEEISEWPIHVDSLGVHRAFQQILTLARAYRLSAYDAAYLELAMREGSPLATLDRDLRRAARTAGVRIVGAK
jgi:predicted nucleic acid-binding protein